MRTKFLLESLKRRNFSDDNDVKRSITEHFFVLKGICQTKISLLLYISCYL
jgi:hypothetical protein